MEGVFAFYVASGANVMSFFAYLNAGKLSKPG